MYQDEGLNVIYVPFILLEGIDKKYTFQFYS